MVVHGANGDHDPIDLGPSLYAVSFVETGLPLGTNWSVRANGTLGSSTGSSIVLSLPNGTYSYSVSPIAGYTTSWTGAVTVDAGPTNVSITFSATVYLVTFEESGLPGGSSWSVTIGSQVTTGSGPYLTLEEPNGSYTYAAESALPGRPAPTGQVNVTGAPPPTILLDFSSPSSGSSTTGLSAGELTGIVVGVVGAAVAAAAVVLWLRRPRSPRGAPEEFLEPEGETEGERMPRD